MAATNLSFLRQGDFFGEISLFRGEPRAATVRAVSACCRLRLGRRTFERIAARTPTSAAHRGTDRAVRYRAVARVPSTSRRKLLPAEAVAAQEARAPEAEPADAVRGAFATSTDFS